MVTTKQDHKNLNTSITFYNHKHKARHITYHIIRVRPQRSLNVRTQPFLLVKSKNKKDKLPLLRKSEFNHVTIILTLPLKCAPKLPLNK